MAIATFILCSCGQAGPERKPTFPVRGTIHVNGQAAENVSITAHDAKGMDKAKPTFTSAITKSDGKFALSTYEEGDGAPEGEYTLTFTWGKFNPIAMQYEGDEFKGKYNDPTKSEFKVKVEKGKPVDLGKIELTSK